jgi:hypothetical protein
LVGTPPRLAAASGRGAGAVKVGAAEVGNAPGRRAQGLAEGVKWLLRIRSQIF